MIHCTVVMATFCCNIVCGLSRVATQMFNIHIKVCAESAPGNKGELAMGASIAGRTHDGKRFGVLFLAAP
ncbi:MAG: hypothetical protein V4713_11625 [Pseudomonadota bacterium]